MGTVKVLCVLLCSNLVISWLIFWKTNTIVPRRDHGVSFMSSKFDIIFISHNCTPCNIVLYLNIDMFAYYIIPQYWNIIIIIIFFILLSRKAKSCMSCMSILWPLVMKIDTSTFYFNHIWCKSNSVTLLSDLWDPYDPVYCQNSNIRGTKSQNLNVPHLVF